MKQTTKRWIVAMAGALTALSLMAGASGVARAQDISGAGATFPAPIYAKWAEAYKQQTGVALNYQSIGSGGGIKQIEASTVTFGASDMPLMPQVLQQNGLVQWPMIIGGAIPVVNLAGVQPGQLLLDGPTIAAIYLGDITRWNDPAIQQLNPRLKLPKQDIAPIYRADGSGTNFLFTNFLSKVSPKFAQQVGSNTSVQWPAGLGAKGNEGVANQVLQTAGAIGYVEYAYVVQTHMTYARLRNAAGYYVAPSVQAFQAAAANADWAKAPGFYQVLTNEPGASSWPITGASYILLHVHSHDKNTAAALKFFDWAYNHGQQLAQQLDYVPIPASVVKMVEAKWSSALRVDGQAVWPAK